MPVNVPAVDISVPGGIVHNPSSPHSREMAKWEMGYSPYGRPGRPREAIGYQPYPALYYKMVRSLKNGSFEILEMVEAVDETMARNLYARGYREGRAAAQALVEEQEQALAVGAAERAASDRGMSDKAKAEAARADDASLDHVAEVPTTPIKHRGRPVKVTS